MLAAEFVRAGHAVKLVTQTAEADGRAWPFDVLRSPGIRALLAAVRWCDLFFHNNLSLRTGWPLALIPRPWCIAHQTWLSRPDRSLAGIDRFKRMLLGRATNVAISAAVAGELPGKATVITNPYDDDMFREVPAIERDRELIFLGRLVSDKGADLLLEALARLRRTSLHPRLTIVGSGPEEAGLRQQMRQFDLAEQVSFAGAQTGNSVAALLQRHRVLVVPSRWEEPFGVVALEGIACGCVVVGSAGGGLPEAIGSCGITFANGDAGALADGLRRVLTDDTLCRQLRDGAPAHLDRHRPAAVAGRYLQLFASLLR